MEVIENYSKSSYEKFTLCGTHGDPIYHPKFLEIVSTFKLAGKRLSIHTNGSGKSISWFERLFQMLDPDDDVHFAIDGLKDTCHLYRVNFKPEDFDKVFEIMKIGANKYKLSVFWNFIVFSFNEHQIDIAKNMAISNGLFFFLKKSPRFIKNDWLRPSDKYVSEMLLHVENQVTKV